MSRRYPSGYGLHQEGYAKRDLEEFREHLADHHWGQGGNSGTPKSRQVARDMKMAERAGLYRTK